MRQFRFLITLALAKICYLKKKRINAVLQAKPSTYVSSSFVKDLEGDHHNNQQYSSKVSPKPPPPPPPPPNCLKNVIDEGLNCLRLFWTGSWSWSPRGLHGLLWRPALTCWLECGKLFSEHASFIWKASWRYTNILTWLVPLWLRCPQLKAWKEWYSSPVHHMWLTSVLMKIDPSSCHVLCSDTRNALGFLCSFV